MAGYIIVDTNTKKVVAICSAIAFVLFIFGIVIGFFSGKGSVDDETVDTSGFIKALGHECSLNTENKIVEQYADRYIERHNKQGVCGIAKSQCLNFGLPRTYIAYHLQDRPIKIDGKLDDIAWNEVPWSEDFVDMRSLTYPKPYLNTKFKIRWSDDRLYIGAFVQETNLWANETATDAKIYLENSLDILIDVDGTLLNYKQSQINVLGTIMDQVFYKSPFDGGTSLKDWSGDIQKAVYYQGTINNSSDTDKFWSVEMSFSFSALASISARKQYTPSNGEVWFMNIARAQYKLQTGSDGSLTKMAGMKATWWSWQPCDTINLHLQDRWGLVQFAKEKTTDKFTFRDWHIYNALFQTFTAMKKYIAVNNKFAHVSIEELDVPPYLLNNQCVKVPKVSILKRDGKLDFEIEVESNIFPKRSGRIQSDRYVNLFQH